MDFTIKEYNQLIQTLLQQGFSFQRFTDFLEKPGNKLIILRHDVDKVPLNSLGFAKIQAEAGVKGTYYFRAVHGAWDEEIISKIVGMGHEIGYHYEDVSLAIRRLRAQPSLKLWLTSQGSGHRAQGSEQEERELADIAVENFKKNLQRLKEIAPVTTICMHGSPISRWDSRLLWKYYDYHDFGIIGEPYFDINFDEVLYLTDTGRRWDGSFVAVRDKAQGSAFAKALADKSGRRAEGGCSYDEWKVKPIKYRSKDDITHSPFPPLSSSLYRFHSTFDIIKAAQENSLPDKIMMTFHPQRWTDKPVPWLKELVWQNVKNVGKYFVVKIRDETDLNYIKYGAD